MRGRTDDPDWELVRKCKRGDPDAFGHLVRRHQRSVLSFCLRFLGNVEDAEDVAQETFVQAYRNIGRFRPRAKFSTWLFTIAKNLSLNLIRDEKRGTRRMVPIDDGSEGVILAADPERVPDTEAAAHETVELVRTALDRLSPEHKVVVVLRDLEGLSYREIAYVMKWRPGTVKSRLSRARANLKRVLANDVERGELI